MFRQFRAAEKLLRSPDELLKVLGSALRKAYAKRSVLVTVYSDFFALFRLVKSWVVGDYREIPRNSLIWAVIAIIYFLSPIDAILDIFPGGYIDDIIVINYIVKRIQVELDKFREWENSRKKSPAIEQKK